MKKFFSLVLALVMVLSLTTVAWGATVEVNDYTTFTGAIADGNEIKLTADIEVTTGFTIPANTTVTIDLNGFKLYAGDASHTFTAAFTMITNKGTLTIKDGSTAKTGKIELAGEIQKQMDKVLSYTNETNDSANKLYSQGKDVLDITQNTIDKSVESVIKCGTT